MATNTQVLVVGAGPVGLFMAAELNRHGVSCRIVDKNDGPTHDSRAAIWIGRGAPTKAGRLSIRMAARAGEIAASGQLRSRLTPASRGLKERSGGIRQAQTEYRARNQ
jgi:2-polyprenyl-6-methoxyphenol hydroxylase-like FAD-dependent oxidoreductase